MGQEATTNVVMDLVRKDEKNPKARRYAELFAASYSGYITPEERDRVCYCALSTQKERGELKSDRYVPELNGNASRKQVKTREDAIKLNLADRFWLQRLAAFDMEKGLEMGEKEAQWYIYINSGIIQEHVASFLRFFRQSPE